MLSAACMWHTVTPSTVSVHALCSITMLCLECCVQALQTQLAAANEQIRELSKRLEAEGFQQQGTLQSTQVLAERVRSLQAELERCRAAAAEAASTASANEHAALRAGEMDRVVEGLRAQVEALTQDVQAAKQEAAAKVGAALDAAQRSMSCAWLCQQQQMLN